MDTGVATAQKIVQISTPSTLGQFRTGMNREDQVCEFIKGKWYLEKSLKIKLMEMFGNLGFKNISFGHRDAPLCVFVVFTLCRLYWQMPLVSNML